MKGKAFLKNKGKRNSLDKTEKEMDTIKGNTTNLKR